MRITESVITRWNAKVNRSGQDECWLWTGSQDGHGYGTLARGHGRGPAKAHRVSWEIHNGPILGGLWVLHRCDNPTCVNPSHLFLGDQKANMRDASEKGRMPGNGVTKGEAHHRTTLTSAQVIEMRRRHGLGQSQVSLAIDFGITQTGVSLIVRRKTWKHI